jgi:hypothetical protein
MHLFCVLFGFWNKTSKDSKCIWKWFEKGFKKIDNNLTPLSLEFGSRPISSLPLSLPAWAAQSAGPILPCSSLSHAGRGRHRRPKIGAAQPLLSFSVVPLSPWAHASVASSLFVFSSDSAAVATQSRIGRDSPRRSSFIAYIKPEAPSVTPFASTSRCWP